MKPLIFTFTDTVDMRETLARALPADTGDLDFRRFPDGESYVRVETACEGRDIIIVAPLERPDDKFLPLLFLTKTLRDLGARRVGLLAPYLAYMRQDREFHAGEAVTSRYFAGLISDAFDWLVTVDPHLHRYHSLNEIYTIPTRNVHAAPVVASWIHESIERPLLIGPDMESSQWVADVAKQAHAPFVVLEKIRRGDRDVEVSVPEVQRWSEHTPVLLDDIISTGRTMIETLGHLQRTGLKAPVCIGIHAVFAEGSYEALKSAGASKVITCNTISHPSNAIDLIPEIVSALTEVVNDP